MKMGGRPVLQVWRSSHHMEMSALALALEDMHFPRQPSFKFRHSFASNVMLMSNEDGRQACTAILAVQPLPGNAGSCPCPGKHWHAFFETATFNLKEVPNSDPDFVRMACL
jgi:hypothetical protein